MKKKSKDIAVRLFPEWIKIFEEERKKNFLSLSTQLKLSIVHVLSNSKNPIDEIKKTIPFIEIKKGGVKKNTNTLLTQGVRIFLGFKLNSILRHMAKENNFTLSNLIRSLIKIYLDKYLV